MTSTSTPDRAAGHGTLTLITDALPPGIIQSCSLDMIPSKHHYLRQITEAVTCPSEPEHVLLYSESLSWRSITQMMPMTISMISPGNQIPTTVPRRASQSLARTQQPRKPLLRRSQSALHVSCAENESSNVMAVNQVAQPVPGLAIIALMTRFGARAVLKEAT